MVWSLKTCFIIAPVKTEANFSEKSWNYQQKTWSFIELVTLIGSSTQAITRFCGELMLFFQRNSGKSRSYQQNCSDKKEWLSKQMLEPDLFGCFQWSSCTKIFQLPFCGSISLHTSRACVSENYLWTNKLFLLMKTVWVAEMCWWNWLNHESVFEGYC